MWSNGETFDFVNFAPDEPNGGTTENCLVLFENSLTDDAVKGKVNDNDCSEVFPFICKRY